MRYIDMTLDGIGPEEAVGYLDRAPKGTYAAYISADGEYADIEWVFTTFKPFERIRRITGYLVGTTDRWNDAKRAELADRVKHGVPHD